MLFNLFKSGAEKEDFLSQLDSKKELELESENSNILAFSKSTMNSVENK